MRGLLVKTRLFCQEVPEPPPSVDVDTALNDDGPCKWDVYAPTREPGCVGCHQHINPIGWGLENFDAQGAYRDTDELGCELGDHTQGDVAGEGAFWGPGQLAELAVQKELVQPCLITQLTRFATGRGHLEEAEEEQALRLAKSLPTDFRFKDVLLALVTSDAFTHRREE